MLGNRGVIKETGKSFDETLYDPINNQVCEKYLMPWK